MNFNVSVLCLMLIASAHSSNADHDSDQVFFPGETDYRSVYNGREFKKKHDTREENTDSKIPLNLIQKLNDIDDISELLHNYVDGVNETTTQLQLASRFGPGIAERSSAIMPKAARCIPTLQTVELKNSNDSNMFYIPSCTRVERCGGCCSHSLLSCQPTQTETLNFQVHVTQYEGGNKLNYKGKEIVLIEQHKKCKCDCIVKEEDCNGFQEYKKDECRCICTNLDEKKKCEKSNQTKLWDPKICKCECREQSECSTGFIFDQNKCTCIRIPIRRRFAELHSSKERPFNEEERYDVESMSVLALQKSTE